MKKLTKVYIAVLLVKNKEPKIIGVYSTKEKANEAYKDADGWVNIIEHEVQ